jgi:hypothetical protein
MTGGGRRAPLTSAGTSGRTGVGWARAAARRRGANSLCSAAESRRRQARESATRDRLRASSQTKGQARLEAERERGDGRRPAISLTRAQRVSPSTESAAGGGASGGRPATNSQAACLGRRRSRAHTN